MGIYCINKDALLEYERLKQNDLFSAIKGNPLSDDTLTILAHNCEITKKHVADIVSDGRIFY